MGLREERPPSLTIRVCLSLDGGVHNWVSGKATDLRGLDVQSLQLHAAQDGSGLGGGRSRRVWGTDGVAEVRPLGRPNSG